MSWNLDIQKTINMLGIYLGHNKSKYEDFYRDDRSENLKQVLTSWKNKVLVMKTLALSKLGFVDLNFTIPKKKAIPQINKILFEFIWGKNDRILRSMVCNDIKN